MRTFSLLITMTQMDVLLGMVGDCDCCPFAHAINRALAPLIPPFGWKEIKAVVLTGATRIRLNDVIAPNPPSMTQWIKEFDRSFVCDPHPPLVLTFEVPSGIQFQFTL